MQEARGIAGRDLLAELKRQDVGCPAEVRWALANALTVVADASMGQEIEALIADKRYEDVCELLKVAAANLSAA